MPRIRTLQRSFGGGEVSPEMFSRVDDSKYQSGLAQCRNFITKVPGPAENRPGFQFVKAVKTSARKTRLIPFTYSTTQTMVLEVGHLYFRFHTQGGTLQYTAPSAALVAKTISAVDIATETLTSNGHGYPNGTPVRFSSTVAIPAGLDANTTYYVISTAVNTFQVSETVGGAAVNLTSVGAGTITFGRYYSAGELASNGGVNYYCTTAHTSGVFATDLAAGRWYALPADLTYEIPSPYTEDDLFDIHYVQSSDVLTIVHPNYAPRELRRLAATQWVLATISFAATLAAPTGVTATGGSGRKFTITAILRAAPGVITLSAVHGLAVGEYVYIAGVGGMVEITDGFYAVNGVGATDLSIRTVDTGIPVDTSAYTPFTAGGTLQPVDQTFDVENSYKVTAVADNGIDESDPSAAASVVNSLYATGAFNTIAWNVVTGALRYNVYKAQSGLYGYIGQTETLSFLDNNIAPDMAITPPIRETVFNAANNYPGAVSYFEQRRCFAGTIAEPQNIWMTKSGTESDMSYGLPVRDDDRISFRVAAREANTIRHIVPLSQLLLLTSSAEWRVTSQNSDAITPTTIAVSPQSYVGASNVQPQIVGTNLIYGASRGGHVRECSYNWQANGFITGNLSLRAAHLFDTFEVVDMAYSKAPQPLLWAVSSTGKLLGLTYVPEQQIGAWHQHDTANGLFESVAVVAEGVEDVLYVVVNRTVNGASVRYVERLSTRFFTRQADAFFVDSGLSYDGANTAATTVTVSTATTWALGEVLTITSSVGIFTFPGTSNVGDAIILTLGGVEYTLTITGVASATVASAIVDKVLPVALRATPTAVWSFGRKSFSGLGHLEGETVSILADGAVHPQRVVTSGAVTLDVPTVVAHIGLPITADLQTLPLATQAEESLGQGRVKNVNRVIFRVYRSSGIFVGPDSANLVEAKQRKAEPYGSPPALKSDEIDVVLTPTWAAGGQVLVRQADPLPLTVTGMTMEVEVGG